MKIIGSVLILTIFFALYGVVHSFLASLWLKNWLHQKFGPPVERWYRLAYNVFAVVTFLPMLVLLTVLPQKTLYIAPAPWRWLMVLGQLTALAGAGITLLQTGLFHFLGLSQLVLERPKQNTSLNFDGFYRWVRHPLYTFSLVILWLSPVMTTNSLTAYLLFTLYFYLGSGYEERRLVTEFGATYENYRRAVPRLIPRPGRRYLPRKTAGEA